MSSATITSKGQATIPKDIRNYLHLEKGDRVEFIIENDGRVTMLSSSFDVSELKGILPKSKKSVTLEDMERVVRKRAIKRAKH